LTLTIILAKTLERTGSKRGHRIVRVAVLKPFQTTKTNLSAVVATKASHLFRTTPTRTTGIGYQVHTNSSE
jgi:hypothetical protein